MTVEQKIRAAEEARRKELAHIKRQRNHRCFLLGDVLLRAFSDLATCSDEEALAALQQFLKSTNLTNGGSY